MYWFCPRCWSVRGLSFHRPSFCHSYTASHLCHLLAETRYPLSLYVPAFHSGFFFFFSHAQSDPPQCTPQQIPAGSLKHPRNPFCLQRLTVIPIMKKYVQEMGDCHRSHGNFILINLGQKLATRASRHSSRLPEVDPIFCLNRH